ncbi:MAG TPA: hypothetical protein VKT82_16665 [Ktedonobacterales bacterium]|nr:hypothetical protein [Ktedonobacterales bacterium]
MVRLRRRVPGERSLPGLATAWPGALGRSSSGDASGPTRVRPGYAPLPGTDQGAAGVSRTLPVEHLNRMLTRFL